jgi:hypothetical protein
MHNYKALKTAGKASVQKVKVVEQAKVDEVKDGDGVVTTRAQEERSREELQVVHKKYDATTGEELDDETTSFSIRIVGSEISHLKSRIEKMQSQQADLEELEKDLKAL